MGKDRLYFLTFISIFCVFLFSGSIGINYSIKINVNLLLESALEESKKEVQKLTYFITLQTENKIDKEVLTSNIQEVLYAVESGVTYLSVLDKNNKLICHPKITQIKESFSISRKLEKAVNQGAINLSAVHDIIMRHKNELNENKERNNLEVFYEKSIKNTDLKIVSVVNLDKLLLNVTKLKRRLYSIFILMGVLIITISFFTVRFIGSKYEKTLEAKNSDLENDIINITKLNLGVFTYQQKVSIGNTITKEKNIEESRKFNDLQKLRILGYKGSEIVPIFIKNISLIYTENSVTYIVDDKGKKSISNASLDEIYKDLDTTLFFRANRQFIINIITIEKIIKYGNSQLKIVINDSDALILIKKNKVAEFKRWLNI